MKIYVLRNRINGKVYVGQTTKTLHERWNWHIVDFTRGADTVLYRAFKKYKPESFSMYELYSALTQEELDNAERAFIALFRATEDEFGYNVAEGGWGANSQNAFVREKLSKARKGMKFPEQWRINIGLGHKGIRRTEKEKLAVSNAQKCRARTEVELQRLRSLRIGTTITAEHKAKISAANRGKPLSDEHKQKISATKKRNFKLVRQAKSV